MECPPVRVFFVDSVEELQQATAHITGDAAHHPKIVVDQPATVLSIHSNVARMGVCSKCSKSAKLQQLCSKLAAAKGADGVWLMCMHTVRKG